MIRSIVFLLLVSSIQLTKSQCTEQKGLSYFKRSVYEFSVNLVNKVAKENEKNFVVTTLTPWIMISALSFGAESESLDEIRDVLRIHQHKCFYMKFMKAIQKSSEDRNEIMIESPSIFIHNSVLEENLKESIVPPNTNINIFEQRYRNTDIVIDNINKHVNVSTEGKIVDIVIPSDIDPGNVLMIDALFFKGTWQNRFSRSRTRRRRFYDADRRNQIGYANFMRGTFEANITFISYIGRILEMPYDNRFSMLIILPHQGGTIKSVLNRLKYISLRTIFAQYERSKAKRVYMEIPKFRIISAMDMHTIFADMGLNGMFGGDTWFPGLLDEDLHMFKYIQKVKVEVAKDFEGNPTRQQKVWNTEWSNDPMDVDCGCDRLRFSGFDARFMANKPFLFMIVDRKLEIVLLTGAYSKPSVYDRM